MQPINAKAQELSRQFNELYSKRQALSLEANNSPTVDFDASYDFGGVVHAVGVALGSLSESELVIDAYRDAKDQSFGVIS